MKRIIFIGALYILVGVAILSVNQRFKPGKYDKPEPILKEASAFVPAYPLPSKIDPDLNYNWALKDNSVIEIKKAWNVSKGDKKIVVAIIDTGIDYNHPDLKNNLWQNPNEIPNNHIDDDHNGFVDDIMGWDFVNNDALPYDEHGHGTHVAGIIGAEGGNGIGISGVCPKVSLMILKYYSPQSAGHENLENTIRAFKYAIQNGAHIINYSGGGTEFSKAEFNTVLEIQKHGILLVAAAGNERQDTSVQAYYPASYDLDNILSVAALTSNKKLVASSNYGVKKIDIAAPGHRIYSTLPKDKYGYMTGTSQATAFVTGVAALALSKHGSMSAKELKTLISQNASPAKSLKGKIKTGGFVNAFSVLSQ